MSKLFQVKQYVKYKLWAVDEHSIHSPFLFDLYTNVIRDTNRYYVFNDFELYRKKISNSVELIEVTDFGAGSAVMKSNKRKVSDILKYSVKESKYAELLFRLVNKFKPKIIVELGTSLGITSLYLAYPNKQSKVYTLEGCSEIASFAKRTFDRYNLTNINLIVGEFKNKLPMILSDLDQVDFVYFDGNHRFKSTLDYFEICLTKANKHSVFVFDDIYWSQEMSEAWKVIKSHPSVRQTLDFFQLGIVFFNSDLSKEDFILKL